MHIVKHEKLCSAEKRSEVRRCQILTSVSNATVTAHGPDLIIPPNLAGGIFGLIFSLTWLYVAMRGWSQCSVFTWHDLLWSPLRMTTHSKWFERVSHVFSTKREQGHSLGNICILTRLVSVELDPNLPEKLMWWRATSWSRFQGYVSRVGCTEKDCEMQWLFP